ncbi:alpha-lactalbumin [Tetranychus urticae]|uniref:lysozyme n=1 Tax=Tetranychus urticae TaxID=32264 RepID=T1KU80_TETUR|nr:alpha-lactalbumin [Tetranychus urticae]
MINTKGLTVNQFINGNYILLGLLIVGLFNLIPVSSREMNRCSLAKSLYTRYKVSKSIIPSLLCLIEHSSKFDAFKITETREGKRYGIFQFKVGEHCGDNGPQIDDSLCRVPCGKMIDDQLTDDVRCWRKIYAKYGFSYWPEWVNNCRGKYLVSYLQGCPLY